MRKLSPEFEKQLQLRKDAETRLRERAAPSTGGWTIGPDALTLLYRLAGNPETAADALRLLSELQTHQVELDLQNHQLRADQDELDQALSYYRELYEFAPVGYLVVDFDGKIIESNRAGAELFGTEPSEIAGQSLAQRFAQGSQSAVHGVIDACRDGAAGVCCSVEASGRGGGAAEPLQVTASLSPGGEEVLLIVSRYERSPR